ncbi:hypothetical protein C1646_765998 [Rhizophagus diaphanus]|nr:hypothetical protein C1646_765998 [Rhizophagus diaphanus] [Rhizophagus sp. MUCL 43196]
MAETIIPITETMFSSCVFTHDYPKSLKIKAHYQSNGRLFISYYNIISLKTYPSTPKLTQKSKNNAIQYPIPDNYIVETEMFERTVVNTFLQKINQNPSTKLSEPRLFGFDIEPLYYARSQIGFQPITAGTKDKRKKPLEEITFQSQQNKRFKSFGEDVHKAQIGFDYKENQVCIKFKDSDPIAIQTRLDAIVRVCDEALLSHDGYRHLAAVVPSLFREYLVADRQNKINELINTQINMKIFNIDQDINQINDHDSDVHTGDILVNNYEVGNGAYRDTLYIKLGGDGQKYETLDKVGKIFAVQLADLKESGIIDGDGVHWPIKFYFSGD